MIYFQKIILQILINSVTTVPQCGYPCLYPMVPAMPALPPPPTVGIPVPVAVPVPIKELVCCTTKNPKENETKRKVEIHFPWPFDNKNFTLTYPAPLPPVPYPVPPPAFPFPYPIPAPPVVMIPLPPYRIPARKLRPTHLPITSDSSEATSSETEYKTSSSDEKTEKHKKRKNHYGIYRRSRRSNVEEVKPVLTYLSEDGKVVFRRYLTTHDRELLMDDNDSVEKVEIVAGEDVNGKSRVLVVANPVRRVGKIKGLGLKTSQRNIGRGKKELVIQAPGDKKITNLSVIFNMEK